MKTINEYMQEMGDDFPTMDNVLQEIEAIGPDGRVDNIPVEDVRGFIVQMLDRATATMGVALALTIINGFISAEDREKFGHYLALGLAGIDHKNKDQLEPQILLAAMQVVGHVVQDYHDFNEEGGVGDILNMMQDIQNGDFDSDSDIEDMLNDFGISLN